MKKEVGEKEERKLENTEEKLQVKKEIQIIMSRKK